MNFSKLKLVTIVVEPILANQIKDEIQEIGSSGVTTTEVQGEGTRNLHAGEVPGNKTKLECVVDPAFAKKVMEHIAEKYFGNFSVITYSQDVEVLRPEKFHKASR